jgi:methylated-DNA-[protein]-cysteine S-methyltransferase
MYYTTDYSSPIGMLKLAADGKSLVGIWLEGQKYYFHNLKGETRQDHHLPILAGTKSWLDRYFAGKKPALTELSLAPMGGEFRQGVWELLCQIPYGKVITYGDLAKIIAHKMNKKAMSAQAVGGAVGHNPIAIIIPCHRVVGARGNLTGYAGGVKKKLWLLAHEGLDTNNFVVPTESLP